MVNKIELFQEIGVCTSLTSSMYVMILPLRDLNVHYDEKEIGKINQKATFLNLNEIERNILGTAWAKWRNTSTSKVLDRTFGSLLQRCA